MATFTIGGGNQGNISPFLTGKATPMSLPSGYLSSAEQQAARMQKAISGVGADIGDAIAAYGKNKEQEEVLAGSLERLKPRLEAAAQAGAMADPSSEESALLKAIENFPSKSRGQKKQILADSLMFLDRQEKERDQLDARYLRGLQTDLVKGKVREMEEGQLLGDALDDLMPWGELNTWEEGEAEEKETQRVSQAQQDTLKAAKSLYENPALQQAVRDAAGKAGEVGVDIWEGIKSLVPQQAPPQSPEQMFPELKGLDDEQKAAIRNFLNLKKRQPVGPGGLPQGDLPELPPLPLPDERLRQPLPMIEGEEELQFKWDDPPTPGQVRRANEIIPGLEPLVAAGDSKGPKPYHDVSNPNAYKTNPSFQRKAKREGWGNARQKAEWEKDKALYTLTDPKLTQKDIDEQEKSLQESLEILKGANQRQQRISQILAQQGAGGQPAPPAIPAPTPSRQEPAWLKPYQQQMRYLESKGHKITKALRDAVKAAAMERFPAMPREIELENTVVVLDSNGKPIFTSKKDAQKAIASGPPPIFQPDPQRDPEQWAFRQPTGTVELLPKVTEDGKALTESQQKAYIFGTRLLHNDRRIEDLMTKQLADGKYYNPASLTNRIGQDMAEWSPVWVGALNHDDKEYWNASMAWISSALRPESGAAIGPKEYVQFQRQYFPLAGDSALSVKNKKELRDLTTQGYLDVASGLTTAGAKEKIRALKRKLGIPEDEGDTRMRFNERTGKIE